MYYKTELSRDVLAMLLIAKKVKINPSTLLLLYEKYKKDIYYFWYLLADIGGLPSVKELYKMLQNAEKYLEVPPKWLKPYLRGSEIVLNLEDTRI